jgi:hypothetical protein
LRSPSALPRRHDAIALARARAEHAVVADEMEARRRDERGEFPGELLRREDGVRRAIAPAVLQAIEQAAVFESREAPVRNRWTRAVATQAFEAAA